MIPLAISHFTLSNALGFGKAATLNSLLERRSGLKPCDFPDVALDTYIGRVTDLENQPVVDRLSPFDCRNNRLAQAALRQDGFEQAVQAAKARYGADRVAVIVGSSTSGILHTELAFRERDPATGALPSPLHYRETHELSSAPEFVRQYFELTGPVLSISTACSSSAKVFASGWRLLQSGLCDAVIVGGVDSLCLTTLYGFSSLELVANEPCRPADAHRGGISIGEAAGFALLERQENAPDATLGLLGYGESVDAHHMSTPHPEGLGAELAMQRALDRAGLAACDIDYINLHGTASRTNDSAEDQAVSRLFGTDVPCSSTKGWTGHTLGAAGITEAIIGLLCIEHGLIPGSLNTRQIDPEFTSRIVLDNETRPVRRVLSNSFGFGGNNVSLIMGRLDT
ncbi:beta-ketoacyl-[acyl-carrier-protein] synthase family protein [Halothiobacillus neapolitanus]|nr:beta-ketoacyl-[acyl-carrier-protein] synthase family protein [Halothiobacillus neapolitanus]OZB73641.1 MAG: beta-ketoacyl-[acyl-carrier-protein] synthase II [Halothiobacillus sp. 14-55-98]